jgi:indole-3-glycerol phosphate synthase
MADILSKIAAYKRREVEQSKLRHSLQTFEKQIETQGKPRGFANALKSKSETGPALIAEIKKASPSKGLIRAEFDPPALAKAYERGGATCLSVLTDGPSFQGRNDYLVQVKKACALPVIRKDFMLDPYQIVQSRALGADAILIIMAMVDDKTARILFDKCNRMGMDALVETHNAEEMRRAVDLGAQLIGINNRNLKTFETSLSVFDNLALLAPKNCLLVAESGIYGPEDLLTLTRNGAKAFLVGESLMRQDDVESATRKLLGNTAGA